jgi:hypothetical protein
MASSIPSHFILFIYNKCIHSAHIYPNHWQIVIHSQRIGIIPLFFEKKGIRCIGRPPTEEGDIDEEGVLENLRELFDKDWA